MRRNRLLSCFIIGLFQFREQGGEQRVDLLPM
jgi:hypothetical protein